MAKVGVDESLLKSLMVLGSVIEARDAYTGGHVWRVSQYSKLLAEDIGMDINGIFTAEIAGFIHDLGKVGVPDSILQKRGALSDEEFKVMRTHPVVGKEIMQVHPLSDLVLDGVAFHHERFDGGGYPGTHGGEELPIFSRIVSIADAFDAMTSTRSYRKGMETEKAMSILESEKDKQFDGKLTTSFIGLRRSNKFDGILGHADENVELLKCPVCGPVIAPTQLHKDGDSVYCKPCGTEFQLHKKGDSFEPEPKKPAQGKIKPEADVCPIDRLISCFPKEITLWPFKSSRV